jgi:hypothetical protein
MRIKRLLDDREVFVGDRLFDAQWRSHDSQAVNELRSIISEDWSRIFYTYAREKHASGNQLVYFLVGIAETKS